MGIPATAPPESPRGVLTHGHLWSRPDGTGLHAPAGELVLEAGTGANLLSSVWPVVRLIGQSCPQARVHGRLLPGGVGAVPQPPPGRRGFVPVDCYPAGCRLPALAGITGPACGRSAAGQDGRVGRAGLCRPPAGPPPGLARLRRAALDAGRATRAVQRDRVLTHRLRELGFEDLASYLRHAQTTGISLRSVCKTTGLGWARLRRELKVADITAGSATPSSVQPRRPRRLPQKQHSQDKSHYWRERGRLHPARLALRLRVSAALHRQCAGHLGIRVVSARMGTAGATTSPQTRL